MTTGVGLPGAEGGVGNLDKRQNGCAEQMNSWDEKK